MRIRTAASAVTAVLALGACAASGGGSSSSPDGPEVVNLPGTHAR